MTQPVLEVLTHESPLGAVHRMKIMPLMQQLPGWGSCRIGKGGDATQAVLINGLYIDPGQYPDLAALLQHRARNTVIMLMIPDIGTSFLNLLGTWSQFVDVFLVPTPEMQNILHFLTPRNVEVLRDPIDFGFTYSQALERAPHSPLKVVWFGFPDSYLKSMPAHENVLAALHQKKVIEYHIVTDPRWKRKPSHCVMHAYEPATFPALLSGFDVCVTSHVPVDFDINSYCKSENKAVLAINRAVPVVASRTPANTRLLAGSGLEEYLFASNAEMENCIFRLSEPDERKRYLSLSQNYVLTHYTAAVMIEEWLRIYESARQRKFG